MDLANRELVNELLEAQAHIWNHTFNFVNSMSLKCAIQLGIPDTIQNHGKPMTLSDLIAALPIHPSKTSSVYRLMRMLLQSGFFAQQKVGENEEEEEEEGYILTPASRLLLKDNPLSVSPFLLAMLDPVLTKPWHHMSTWFQNEDPTSFYTAHGESLWQYGAHEQRFNNLFNEGMASDTRLVTSVMINQSKQVFDGLECLVDVGGGNGTAAKEIANAFPHLDCTVFDLPHVVAGLQGTDNLKFVGGDMFEAIPTADAILLKWLLHSLNDEKSVKILKQCKEAIMKKEGGGKVIIIELVMENRKGDEESKETHLFFDMLMMVVPMGKEREEKEWAKLFLDAGFSTYKITPILGLRSIIEVFP